MNILNILTLVLLVVGGLNWGLVGIAGFDLVAAILGDGSVLARLVYSVVGLSAVFQAITIRKAMPAHAR